jgi:integrase
VTDGALDNTVNRGKRLMQHFEVDYDLCELSTEAMVGYAVKARETRAPTTVRGELDILLAAARAVGLLPPKRPKVKGGAKPQEPLTPEQVRLFFVALPYDQRLLGLALITLGPRASEIAKIDDVDWEARTLWVYGTKTVGSRRQLPIPDELFAHMLELRRWGHWKGFPTITRQAIDKTVRKACVRAGIGPRSVNDLRGTWATLAALEGVSPDVRAAWQGNSPQMQAKTYAQPGRMPEEMRRAAERGVPRVRKSGPTIDEEARSEDGRAVLVKG